MDNLTKFVAFIIYGVLDIISGVIMVIAGIYMMFFMI